MKKIVCILILLYSVGVKAQSPDYIVAWMSGTVEMHDSTSLTLWGFSNGFGTPTLPGPVIYVNEGDSVRLRFRNQSMTPHTIHLHGLDVDQANDGVPQTSYSVLHGDETYYRFKAPHPGTYLYHCHVASVVHVQLGMYGMMIVNAKQDSLTTWTNGYAFDTHEGWVLSEIDENWFTNVPNHNSGPNVFDVFEVPAYEPDYFLINGKSEQQLETLNLSRGERFYLRLANVGNYFNTIRIPAELNPLVVASDGRPLPNTLNGESLRILPGERYGVLLTPETDFSGQIEVSYANMNTYVVENTQRVAVEVAGVFGVQDQTQNKLRIYPNPANSHIIVDNGQKTSVLVTMKDMTGRDVLHTTLTPNQRRINISALTPGTYFITVRDQEGSLVQVEKVVKF